MNSYKTHFLYAGRPVVIRHDDTTSIWRPYTLGNGRYYPIMPEIKGDTVARVMCQLFEAKDKILTR